MSKKGENVSPDYARDVCSPISACKKTHINDEYVRDDRAYQMSVYNLVQGESGLVAMNCLLPVPGTRVKIILVWTRP